MACPSELERSFLYSALITTTPRGIAKAANTVRAPTEQAAPEYCHARPRLVARETLP